MRVAIIGAGPSALVTAKTLLEAADSDPSFQPSITIFEAEEDIGGTFRYRSYSNATLVSSKQLTSFSDFRLPLDHKDHLTLPEYVQYLQDYTDRFQLRKRCDFRMRTKVVKAVKVDGGHLLRFRSLNSSSTSDDQSEHFTHLCVCSGLHVVPALPVIPGLPSIIQGDQDVKTPMGSREMIPAEVPQPVEHATKASEIVTLHSSQFKDRSLFSGKRVLIMGTGETGMDMAYEAVKAGATEISLCTRSGFLHFPAVLADFVVFGNVFDGNLPIDGLITNLFETAYVHPWVASAHLRWFVSDFVIKRVLWALTGTQAGCNQWVGELEDHRLGRAYTFLNKSGKAMPYINRSWKTRSKYMERISRYLDPPTVKPEETSVDLAPPPASVDEDGTVTFVRNGRKEDLRMRSRVIKPDVVVYATGYTQEFEFLGKDYPVPATVRCRDVFDPSDPTVAFIGFVRPGVGAIPPIAEMQAQMWTLVLRNKIPFPLSTPHYYLLVEEQARIKYGVDYSSYVAQLARDMGSAPPLSKLLWYYGPKITLIYCFGAAFTTFYRLLGPYRHPDAKRIVETEIYDTIQRRGVIGNIMMGLIPMIFYAYINLLALVLEQSLAIVSACTRPFVPRALSNSGSSNAKSRRYQNDFASQPVEQDVKPSTASAPARGRMLRLFALLSALLMVAVPSAQANTEIRNFGPVLCRADEYGHLAAKAADQLSTNWPVLRPSSSPSTFTVRPLDGAMLSDSKEGAWLVLDLSAGGKFKLPSPADAFMYRELMPRDRWVRQTLDKIAWFFTKRFSLRLSIAAHHGVEVYLSLYGPEEALQVGGIEWKAELVDTAKIAHPRPAETAAISVPNHAVIYSAVPKETGTPKEADTVVFSQSESSAGPSSILASDTIVMDDQDPPMSPCSKIYLHLIPVRTGIPIPAPAEDSTSRWGAKLAETLYGPLWDAAPRQDGVTHPVHLTLDQLYFGAVPNTAVTMLPALALMLCVGWLVIRPQWHALLSHVDKHPKSD